MNTFWISVLMLLSGCTLITDSATTTQQELVAPADGGVEGSGGSSDAMGIDGTDRDSGALYEGTAGTVEPVDKMGTGGTSGDGDDMDAGM